MHELIKDIDRIKNLAGVTPPISDNQNACKGGVKG